MDHTVQMINVTCTDLMNVERAATIAASGISLMLSKASKMRETSDCLHNASIKDTLTLQEARKEETDKVTL